ncbi:DUF4283 domain-containing protein [Cephalotus follicularis]|uniref:DUF4283 domain-containing protein n=1 Tax=Cephalotus follicularis TaxID=3775 RepID=A0A1Q3D967_CEPFO|nr:DUF4283 domain-containing protein [Cephalotus follicularis]
MPPPGPPPPVGAPPAPPTSGSPSLAAGVGHSSPSPPLKTFASVLGAPSCNPFCPLSSLPSIPPIPLSPISLTSFDGLPLLSISPSDYQAAASFTHLTLLAKFASNVPTVNAFDVEVNTTWGLSKPATVGLLDQRHIAIQFQSQEDLSAAWSSVSCVFSNKRFLLLRWSPHRHRDSPLAAVWIRLPGLPIPLHNPSILQAIGDSLGRYLRSDENTIKFKHPWAARICVELDLSKPPPSALFIAVGERKLRQRLVYETRLLYCQHCHLQGHRAATCRSRKRNMSSVSAPQTTPSGTVISGGLLPAGTYSNGLPNPPHPLPVEALHKRPPDVCGNASMAPPLSNQAHTRAVAPADSPLTLPVAPAQALSPPDPLVGSALYPPALSPSPTSPPLAPFVSASCAQAQPAPLLGCGLGPNLCPPSLLALALHLLLQAQLLLQTLLLLP